MESQDQVKEKKSVKQKKKEVNKTLNIKIRGRKIRTNRVEMKQSWLRKVFSKRNITYLVLLLLDISLVIYVARKNIVNYVEFGGYDLFVGEKKILFLGRNYINVIITVFFYAYFCMMNRFFLKQKNTKRFLFILFFGLVILNGVLFYLFVKRVY